MARCKDCIHFCVCDRYTAPNESYPEVGGCGLFKATADVVEVIRCKDCKYFTQGYIGGDLECICERFDGMAIITPDSYCSCGERKE